MSGLFIATMAFKADLSFEQVGFLLGALDDAALSSSLKETGVGTWECLWTLEDELSPADILSRLDITAALHGFEGLDFGAITVEPMPEVNWLAVSYEGFQPFAMGPFFIYGSHHRDTAAIPANSLPLEIDAATAFGSGEHGTTAGCLLALQKLYDAGFAPRTVLDMGTGSGILAIAALKRWPDALAYAVDNDPECIVVTERHAAVNKVDPAGLVSYVSEGFDDNRVHSDGPYDLVIANILAAPLIAMAADLAEATAPDGCLILSGLLETQRADVTAAYEACGMRVTEPMVREEWAILTLKHQA